jgi:hypothetical protein
MRHAGTSDRNFYDRCYFNAHDRTGDIFVITGLGVYPNLGVIDAYATVRRGNRQATVRMSDALGEDRMQQSVGPYRIEVVEPLRRIRLICDADAQGVGFDLTWDGSFPVVDEPVHVSRSGGRIILDAQRFAQVGTWSGVLRVDGDVVKVSPDRWVGTRDRSWGIRPVGETEPPGRNAAEPQPGAGFYWVYVPLRFDDFGLVVIVQEDGDGTRTLNGATRIWPASLNRPPEQLGWPEIDVHYRPGTRHPLGATLHMTERGGKPIMVEIETLGYIALNNGPGYGDPTWSHGQWRGRGWIERSDCDVTDSAVTGGLTFSVVDHVGRAVCDGAEGWGLFEHASIGRHDPSGFADFAAVAP